MHGAAHMPPVRWRPQQNGQSWRGARPAACVAPQQLLAPTASYKITQKAEGVRDGDGESGPRRDARFAC